LVGGWNLEKAYWFWIFGDKSLTRIGLACDPGLDEVKLWFPSPQQWPISKIPSNWLNRSRPIKG
jgi:hypothetical protein